MSIKGLFQDLYFDSQRELAHQRDLVSYYRTRLTQAEGQRCSLMFHLRMACKILSENNFPETANMHMRAMRYLESDYADTLIPKPERPPNQTPVRVPGGPTNETGSGQVFEVAQELESPQGVPVSDSGAGIPPVIAYEGDWDSTAAQTGGVKP